MSTAFRSAAQWAQEEFGFVQLGDRRRNRRLVKIAFRKAQHPGGTLPESITDWAELKAAYRFLSRPGGGHEQIQATHRERTQRACREPGEYLIIEDSSDLSFTGHPGTEDLGMIGDGRGRGLSLHTALAVRVEGWNLDQRPEGRVVGLFDQQCCAPRRAPKAESRKARLSRVRKTQRWASGLRWAGPPAEGSQWIYVADRESDFYEPLQRCEQHRVDFIIRANHDRRLARDEGHLRETVGQAPVLGRSVVELRARPGQAARSAVVELRCVKVDLGGPWRPGGWQEPIRGVTVVEVREVDAPQEVKQPLHWVLLSSLPAESLAAARRIVGRYSARWWVEEYHKALKSGAGVEESQLKRAYRLEALVAILAVVAVRLLQTKLLARSRPEGSEAMESLGPEVLGLLEKKLGRPKEGWTNQNTIVAIARLGGFLARKRDGSPGWQTIWRGWQRLIWMCEGIETLNEP